MSNDLPTGSSFDFWEFVVCTKCHLSFIQEPGKPPKIPFWLTDCGHVICNSHLNTDQSCPQCDQKEVGLMPLQFDLEHPFCNLFRSATDIQDSLHIATKYQQETMADQIRYYRKKCFQQQSLIEKLKKEMGKMKELKRQNENLRQMVEQFQQQQIFDEPSQFPDKRGKRRMLDQSSEHGPPTHSSPRSIATPLGPDRITLPPGQPLPKLAQNQAHHPRPESHSGAYGASGRPGSKRFTERYAYEPPQTPQIRSAATQSIQHSFLQQPSSSMLANKPNLPSTSATPRYVPPVRRVMGPPPTPQHRADGQNTVNTTATSGLSNRFISNTSSAFPQTSLARQAFAPNHQAGIATPSSGPRRFNSVSQARETFRLPTNHLVTVNNQRRTFVAGQRVSS